MTTKDKGITFPTGSSYVDISTSVGLKVTPTPNDYTVKTAWNYGAAYQSPINLICGAGVAPTDFIVRGQDANALFAAPGGNLLFRAGVGSVGNVSGNILIQDSIGNGGAWNTTHPVFGTYHVWIDTSGRLRTKVSTPANTTDGIQILSADFTGSTTYDPPNLADGAGTTTTVGAAGAALGDFALCSFSLDTQGIVLYAWVSSANVVSVRFQNESGGALDLGSGTLRVRVVKLT